MNDMLNGLVSQLSNKAGGLNGVVSKLSQNGLGQQVQSWIGSGKNEQVSSQQVADALGPDHLKDLAQKTGSTPDQVAGQLADQLPGAVDKATPDGQAPQGADAGSGGKSLLGNLGSMLHGKG